MNRLYITECGRLLLLDQKLSEEKTNKKNTLTIIVGLVLFVGILVHTNTSEKNLFEFS